MRPERCERREGESAAAALCTRGGSGGGVDGSGATPRPTRAARLKAATGASDSAAVALGGEV